MSYPAQHARCSDKAVVRILERVYQHLGSTDPLSAFGRSGFHTRWNHLLSALGVPLAQAPAGFLTPAFPCSVGAADFHMATEAIARIFWHSCWRQESSAERYLRTAAAPTVLSALPDAAQARVTFFSDASDALVASFLSDGPGVGPIQLAAARQTLVTAQGL